MDRRRHCYNPQLVIPSTFAECLTYGKQILWLAHKIEDLQKQIDELKPGELTDDDT